ncbi:MAG TPA: aldehyde reductase [Bradyrhizobium sp.]|nr:aldehyde reductase [Bradyrhizobium sp.]
MSKVLVTGGTGFVAGHIILKLLAAGYTVRTTLRSPDREGRLRKVLESAGMQRADALSCVVADLECDQGWAEAVAGCDRVLHVASPFPVGAPANEDELIGPARNGTLRVLQAARDGGVQRLVMTSSFAAIGYGHPLDRNSFDETDWTNVKAPGVSAYVKSKTLAERAAWDFIAQEGGGLELSVVNPVGIFGPILGEHISASTRIIKRMLDGGMPGCPRIYFGVVDVRDVADLHVRAMTHPAAKGERFLAVAGTCVSMFDVAQMLARRLGEAAARVPRREIPNWQMRIAALFNPEARQTLPNVGKVRNSSNAKARSVLGWEPRPTEEAVVASAESLINLSNSQASGSRL